MREAVFRSLAGLASALFLVGAVLMLMQGFDPAILMLGGIGLFFALYAALGEYKIRWLLRLIGAKDNTSQKSG